MKQSAPESQSLTHRLLLLSLFILTAPSSHAVDNSITEDSPNYSALDKSYLFRHRFNRTDDIEWNQNQPTSALIFDPNGTSEPIRSSTRPFNSGGAYIDNSTGDISVEGLFGDPSPVRILNFNGSTINDL